MQTNMHKSDADELKEKTVGITIDEENLQPYLNDSESSATVEETASRLTQFEKELNAEEEKAIAHSLDQNEDQELLKTYTSPELCFTDTEDSTIFYSDEDYPVHPLRENDAEMSEIQFNGLKLDLLAYGQIEPIILFQGETGEYSILDGRARKKACFEIKIKPAYKIYSGSENLLDEFVKSKQIHRIHYTKDQLACYAAEVKQEVKERNRELLSQKMRALAKGDNVSKLPDINTYEYLQNLFGVGKTYILDAEKLLKADQDLFKKVKAGKISLIEANRKKSEDSKEKKAQEEKVKDQFLKEQEPNKPLSFIEKAKVKEFLDLGFMKKEAERKVLEISQRISMVKKSLEDEPKIKKEIILPSSINSYLENALDKSDFTIDELFTEWVISYTNFSSNNIY